MKRVVLNDQYSSLANNSSSSINSWSPFFHSVYINDLSDNLSNHKLFADDTSLFLVVQDFILSSKSLNDDIKRINKWDFQ